MLKVPVHDGNPFSPGLVKPPDKGRPQSPLILPVDDSDPGVLSGETFEDLWCFVGAVVDKEKLEIVF